MIKIKQIHYVSDKGRLENDSMFYEKKFLCKEYKQTTVNNSNDINDDIENLVKSNDNIDNIIKLSKFTAKSTNK